MSNRRRMTKMRISEAENMETTQYTKTAIDKIFVQAEHLKESWNLKHASTLLRGVLKRILEFEFDNEVALFSEFKNLGFYPEIVQQSSTVSFIWITDPNLGRLKIELHYKQMQVH